MIMVIIFKKKEETSNPGLLKVGSLAFTILLYVMVFSC